MKLSSNNRLMPIHQELFPEDTAVIPHAITTKNRLLMGNPGGTSAVTGPDSPDMEKNPAG